MFYIDILSPSFAIPIIQKIIQAKQEVFRQVVYNKLL